jgi:ATP-dependent Clp protease ATP-binding subunit ClpB
MGKLKMLLDPHKTGREAQVLMRNLKKRIVGQDEAIAQIVEVYQTYLAGMSNPERPVGSFLFLGPTGSGKTRTVEAVAESLIGNSRAVIKIDCGEFQHSHEIAKLIGSPPGYIGHRETHALLSQEVLNQFQTDTMKLNFVLFDEIEKASDALWNLLLGILDKATLTLGDNRRVDFSQSLIFMTSNLGAGEMSAVMRPGLGFAAGVAGDEQAGKIAQVAMEAARRRFSPEFINRIDKMCVFRPLGEAELRRILGIELERVEERISRATGSVSITFKVNEAARDYLLKNGTDTRYGARHLQRTVERLVAHPLANLIATGQVHAGDSLLVDFDADSNDLRFLKDEPPAVERAAAA